MTEIVCKAGGASCTIVAYRPKWSDVYRGYPKSGLGDMPAPEVFSSVLAPEHYDTNTFSNACATRVSLGLLEGGMRVRPAFNVTNSTHKFFGRGFQSSARGLFNWLSSSAVFGSPDISIEGPTNISAVRNKIGTKNGIYIILGGFSQGITGHATLWIGVNKDVVGGNNYADIGENVFFWELID